MIDVLIIAVSILSFFVYTLFNKVKNLQQQVNDLDNEQHAQNKELMEVFKFQQRQHVLNEQIMDVIIDMQSNSNVQKYYGIVGEA